MGKNGNDNENENDGRNVEESEVKFPQEAEAEVDDTTYEDEDEREREKREQERKYQVRKMFWCTRDDDDPFWDDEDIGAEFFQLDAEYDVLQEIKQHKNALRDNDDEDNVDVEESEASCDAELRMERGIQIQQDVDEDIVSDKVKMREESSPTIETIDGDRIFSFFEQIDRDKGKYAWEMLVEDIYDDNTREAFREILQEELSAQFDDDGIKFCDSLFVFLAEIQEEEIQEEANHQQEEAIKSNKNKQRNNINKNNMIAHIRYADLETNRSVEILGSTFWCYFDLHGGTTRMVNDPGSGIKKNRKTQKTPVTIAAKASPSRTKKRIQIKYSKWLGIRKFRKQLLMIPEIILEGEEKEYMFREQQEAQEAEVESWEKEQREERQRQLQERQQQQKQRKKKHVRDDDDDDDDYDDDTMMT